MLVTHIECMSLFLCMCPIWSGSLPVPVDLSMHRVFNQVEDVVQSLTAVCICLQAEHLSTSITTAPNVLKLLLCSSSSVCPSGFGQSVLRMCRPPLQTGPTTMTALERRGGPSCCPLSPQRMPSYTSQTPTPARYAQLTLARYAHTHSCKLCTLSLPLAC